MPGVSTGLGGTVIQDCLIARESAISVEDKDTVKLDANRNIVSMINVNIFK